MMLFCLYCSCVQIDIFFLKSQKSVNFSTSGWQSSTPGSQPLYFQKILVDHFRVKLIQRCAGTLLQSLPLPPPPPMLMSHKVLELGASADGAWTSSADWAGSECVQPAGAALSSFNFTKALSCAV